MKTIILFLLCFPFFSFTPIFIKKADRAEYQAYMAYCVRLVPVQYNQFGKAKLVPLYNRQPGDPKAIYRGYRGSKCYKEPMEITWFKLETNPKKRQVFVYEVDECDVSRKVTIYEKRRIPSVKDFYKNWKTGLIRRN